MPREVISTADAPEHSGYSQAVKAGNTIYVAGTVGVDVTTGELAGPTIQEQTRQSLLNCRAILRAGGAELSDAVMVHRHGGRDGLSSSGSSHVDTASTFARGMRPGDPWGLPGYPRCDGPGRSPRADP